MLLFDVISTINDKRETEMANENNPALNPEIVDILEESRYSIDTTPAENKPDPKRI